MGDDVEIELASGTRIRVSVAEMMRLAVARFGLDEGRSFSVALSETTVASIVVRALDAAEGEPHPSCEYCGGDPAKCHHPYEPRASEAKKDPGE